MTTCSFLFPPPLAQRTIVHRNGAAAALFDMRYCQHRNKMDLVHRRVEPRQYKALVTAVCMSRHKQVTRGKEASSSTYRNTCDVCNREISSLNPGPDHMRLEFNHVLVVQEFYGGLQSAPSCQR